MLKFVIERPIPAFGASKAAEPQAISQWATAATMPWRWLAWTIARLQRKRQQWRELQLLDQNALRDLGLDRSELGSYEAEAVGAAICTRRRVSNVPISGDSPE